MAYHPCPRCKRLIPVGVSYCTSCKPIAEAQAAEAIERRRAYKVAKYNKSYNKRRDPKCEAFYNSKDWRVLSAAYLEQHRYCEAKLEDCKRIACEAHHKDPIQTPTGWERRLDWTNLEAVCSSCHNRRHPEKTKRKKEPGVIDLRFFKKK